jgi:hypothetical protein
MSIYSDAQIYEILFGDTGDSYVGSTIQPLHDRLQGHKSSSTNKLVGIAFVRNKNYKIVLIEKYPCDTRCELLQREQFWMNEKKPTLNIHNAYNEEVGYKPKTNANDSYFPTIEERKIIKLRKKKEKIDKKIRCMEEKRKALLLIEEIKQIKKNNIHRYKNM